MVKNMAMINDPGRLCIIKKKEFLASRPEGWRNVQNKLSNVDNEFTVMVQDPAFEGRDTFCEINSVEELEATRDLIMRRPLFTTAKCKKPYDDSNLSETQISYLEDDYVVLVNTANPEIGSQFNRAFELAENYLRQGNNFRITVCLSESLKAYYNANVHAHGEDNRLTQAWGCDIHLTHGVKAPNCCDRNLTCETSPQIAMWVVCFPICLVTGIPYLCYKKCIMGLKEEKVRQIVPIKVLNGPFQAGYILHSLLYDPINYQPGF